MLPETLPKTLYRPANEQLRITDKNINDVVKQLTSRCPHFTDTIWTQLKEAIKDENQIGLEFDNPSGSIYKRIQKWFWNNFSFNFVPMKGENMDILESSIQKCREDTLTFPVEVQLQRLMDWSDGDFGDKGSCYFGGNAVTRRYLNSQENFRTIRIWKDGKGYGRALILSDVAGEDLSLIYNTYPGHHECKYQTLFTHALVHSLTTHHKEEYACKEVTIENRSSGSWFYTNGNRGMLVYPARLVDKAKKTDSVVMSFGAKPEMRRIDGYVCDCASCSRMRDDGSSRGTAIFAYDKYKALPGTRTGAGICQQCLKSTDSCSICNKKVIIVSSNAFNLFQVDGIGTSVETKKKSGERGDNLFVCNTCFDVNKHRLII